MCSRLLEILLRPQMINSTVWISELPPGKENTFYFKSRVCSRSTGKFPPLPLSTQRSGCRENSANIGERTGMNLPLKARSLSQEPACFVYFLAKPCPDYLMRGCCSEP